MSGPILPCCTITVTGRTQEDGVENGRLIRLETTLVLANPAAIAHLFHLMYASGLQTASEAIEAEFVYRHNQLLDS